MRQKTIWMLLLLIGAAGSVSCRKHTDDGDVYINEYIYRNSTSYAVEMVGYSHSYSRIDSHSEYMTPEVFFERWQIKPLNVVEFRVVHNSAGGSSVLTPTICDSVRIVFDGKKVLMYRNMITNEEGGIPDENKGTIFDPDRYIRIKIGEDHTELRYEITDADYRRADDCTGVNPDADLVKLMQ